MLLDPEGRSPMPKPVFYEDFLSHINHLKNVNHAYPAKQTPKPTSFQTIHYNKMKGKRIKKKKKNKNKTKNKDKNKKKKKPQNTNNNDKNKDKDKKKKKPQSNVTGEGVSQGLPINEGIIAKQTQIGGVSVVLSKGGGTETNCK